MLRAPKPLAPSSVMRRAKRLRPRARRVREIGQARGYWWRLSTVALPACPHHNAVALAITGNEIASDIAFDSAYDRRTSSILDREAGPSAELLQLKSDQTRDAAGKNMLLHRGFPSSRNEISVWRVILSPTSELAISEIR